ncbi:MAG: hypothetical protein IJ410_09475 [Oscillospiraceae bacterium]|nr:hypothetical protein [Oscillospiraceae bacterium]
MKTIDFTIDKSEMLRYTGHRGDIVPPHIDRIADKVLSGCVAAVTPRSVVRRYSIEPVTDGVAVGNTGLILAGKDIKNHLSGCSECYIICVTAGTGADSFIRTMMAVDTVHGLLADGAATAAVESCCDSVENTLREELKKEGKYLTWRYSPGYGDFPFTQQPDILALLQADKFAGVICTDSCMMIPSKSVTAIMGIADSKPAHRQRKCDTCPNKDNCNFSCR